MILFFMFLVVLVPLLLRLLFRRLRIHYNPLGLKINAWIHGFFILLYLVSLCMASHDTYLRGYASLSLLFVLMVVSGISLYLFIPHAKNRLGITIPLAIFSSVGALMALFITTLKVADHDRNIYYDTAEYRLEEKERGLMAPPEMPALYVKHGLLETEYEDTEMRYLSKEDIQGITIEKLGEEMYKVVYHFKDTVGKAGDRITVVYQ